MRAWPYTPKIPANGPLYVGAAPLALRSHHFTGRLPGEVERHGAEAADDSVTDSRRSRIRPVSCDYLILLYTVT